MLKMTVKRIGTHNGTFHADESLAVYMLKLLPRFKDAQVIRTRDPALLEECDIVVDVSGKYEPPKYFDHHQRGFDATFSDDFKTKLSSAGLIYKHFGKEVIQELLKDDEEKVVEDPKALDVVFKRVYSSFVEALDASDNGISAYPDDVKSTFSVNGYTLPSLVSRLNPIWRDPATSEVLDSLFEKASTLMGEAFENVVYQYGRGWYPAKKHVQNAFDDRFKYDDQGRIMVFETFVPWKEHLFAIEEDNNAKGNVLYILYTDSNDAWRIQAVPESATSFQSRRPLPESWRGVRDGELAKVCGIEDAFFVHAAGFIGGAKSKEGALEMARKALSEAKRA